MRRSMCTCEPPYAFAGEVNTWRFVFTPAATLPKGTQLLFDMGSFGRPIDWDPPSTDVKEKGNVIWAHLSDGKPLVATEFERRQADLPSYLFTLPVAVKGGSPVTIVVGAPKGKTKPEYGNRAQTHSQRRRPFFLYVDTTGKKRFEEPETFTMDVKGNHIHTIKVITPSVVGKNKRFDIVVRIEDEFGNLTSSTENENALIELTHEHIRENLSWKLFIPETGYLTLPNLYFNEVGTYTITLKNLSTKEVFQSPPIRCVIDDSKHIYWGLLHGESERVDSTENIESCLRHFRDEKSLHFFASSSFEDQEETPNEVWKVITQTLPELNEEDRFATLVGMQWVGEPKTEGVRQFIYMKDQKQIIRQSDSKYSTLKKIYKSFNPKELISIPSFTMGKGYHYSFQDFNPDFERLVEIYNSWGSSECTEKQGNPCPITPIKKMGVTETAEGAIQTALQNNCRFGFVAGGLDDRGIYADFYDNEQAQYPPGLTAILAPNSNREAVLEALYSRSTYATTGERMVLSFSIAGASMGKEIDTSEMQGLLVNRHIVGYAAGTCKLSTVEIIRNGKVIHIYQPKDYYLEFAFDDLSSLEKCVITPKDKKPPFTYYYLRVTQEDGHIAWSSPIWIDILPAVKREIKRPVKAAPEPIKEEEIDEDFDDVDDDYDDA